MVVYENAGGILVAEMMVIEIQVLNVSSNHLEEELQQMLPLGKEGYETIFMDEVKPGIAYAIKDDIKHAEWYPIECHIRDAVEQYVTEDKPGNIISGSGCFFYKDIMYKIVY